MIIENLMLLGALVTALAAALLGWNTGRRRMLAQIAAREARVDRLERDLRALCAAGARVGDRVVEVEQELRRVMQWQSQLELRTPQTEPLRHAINLVERGASPDDLVAACGLSRGEAELMARFRSNAA